ncbi:tlde1 domain-containing protein [Rhodopirellula sallentina]|uniref:Peptidoglycan binding-like domain protein n=1 Tax=Rhodopirellula sallentina SM41 TaxID=1263870 RepID=M5U1K7_9BACT|nr:peptidoglycan-binding protein [Rhodopirellula sallentina]EMI55320.1 Peptidoglycan binding-like domain protein [Rhodopirellula sallentina SM41]
MGDEGPHVQLVQKLLGISSDGKFGNGTQTAVKAFQTKSGLTADGIVGKDTWKALRGSGAFQYDQSSGELKRNKIVWAKGYSGAGAAKNDPSQESVKNKGPIPAGKWKIAAPIDSKKTGKFVLPLTPEGHTAHGRTAFQIHGDSVKNPGTASSGCVILPRHIREHIAASGEKTLSVVK